MPVNAEKIRISIVNYTNTLPFKWALKRSRLMGRIDLQEDIPSICAQKLKFGQVDLALVPVALIPELEHYRIVGNYCIGAVGKVDTVKLYSTVPLNDILEVILDYQSKSSNSLLKVLFKDYWKKQVVYRDALPGFENTLASGQGMVVIGDRTFALNGKFPYEFDLSEEWHKVTGLPFVFACWISTGTLDITFEQEFDNCLAFGIEHIPQAVKENLPESPLDQSSTIDYLTRKIDFRLDEDKRKGLQLFLKHLKEL